MDTIIEDVSSRIDTENTVMENTSTYPYIFLITHNSSVLVN